MITGPDWQEPVYTNEQLNAIGRKRYVTTTEFFAVLRRAIRRMSPEEKAEFRRAVMEDMLLKMKPETDYIQ